MREFFHGRRRKIGLVTLMLAVVFMVGWVRSEYKYERVISFHKGGSVQLASVYGRLFVARVNSPPAHILESCVGFRSDDILHWTAAKPATNTVAFDPLGNLSATRRWDFVGFHYGIKKEGLNVNHQTYTVPFWAATLLLTLLSADLLLVKPRAPTPNNASETALFEGV